ncbi:MAG: Gfo/Idh/MocA family oxidoreductase [Terracidiphilus sp.]
MIRVGLIGFGMAARVFHAPLLSSVEGLELAAVLERTSNKAAERYPGIAVHRSLDDLLADASLDLFVVASPNATHFALAKEILGAGRNVIVDKPMTLTSAEAAELIGLARQRNVLLAPFHNRRWDSDFLTVRKVLHEGLLGCLVAFESRLDRWRPLPLTERRWKESAEAGGGTLHDLGPHLADQALVLFGKPEAVSADVLREKDGPGANDAIAIRLRYPGLAVTLGANSLSLPARPRFHLRGTKGSYSKNGVDPQEAALNKIVRIDTRTGDPAWGQEPAANWGVLHTDIDGGSVSRPVPALPGDYRLFYAGIRDALLGKAPAPVAGVDGWRVARLLEYAAQSSDERREIACDWSHEPWVA